MQHKPIKHDQEKIKRMQKKDAKYSEVIKHMKTKIKVSGEFSFNAQGVLYMKIQDHAKEFTELIVLKLHQRYVLYEIHTSLGHNVKTRLY